MPIYSPTGFLDITNATLRTSNVEAENLLMTGGNIYVTSELETNLVLNLENVTNKGNITSNTIQFTNTKTSLIASSNVDVVGNVFAYKFIGSGAGLTNIPPSAITGTLSQWSDGTNGDVYIASNVGIGNVHTLTSNTLQVGGNLYVRDTDANVLTVNGNVVASYFEGDGSKLSGIVTDLQGVTDNGNVTTNVVQFSNATTGLVTTANVEVGGDVKIAGLTAGTVPYVGSDKFLKDSFITTTGDATVITSNLDVTGNIFMRGEKYIVNSETKLINDAIIGIANNNTVSTTDKGIIMQNTAGNVAIIHHGTGDGFADQLTFGYTDDPLDTITVTNDLTKELTVNVLGNVITQNNLSVGGTLSINNITAAAQHSLQAVTNVGNTTSNTVQFTNTFTSLTASSNIVATGNVSAGYDTDTTSHFGRAAVGYMGTSDHASFAHVDHNTTSDYAIKQTASGPTYINTTASGHIRFTVADGLSNAEKMRITNAGNVGIGASSPGYKLDVYGTANVGVLTATTVTTSGGATFNTNTLKVDAVNSRVGIGTASPRALLDVSGPVNVPAILTSGAGPSEGDIAVISGEAMQIGHWDNGTSTFTNRIHISDSGNVGIGTSSPEGQLHLSSGTSGDCFLIMEADTDNNNEGDNPKIVFRQDGGYIEGEIGLGDNYLVYRSVSTSGGHRFYVNDTAVHQKTDYNYLQNNSTRAALTIDEQGNVGIGFTSPGTLGTHTYSGGNSDDAESGRYILHLMGWMYYGDKTGDNETWITGIGTSTSGEPNHFLWRFSLNGASPYNVAYINYNTGSYVDVKTFTGQHRAARIEDIPPKDAHTYEGLIVVADKNAYESVNGEKRRGKEAITTNEAVPFLTLSKKVCDKRCFGVISASEDPDKREQRFGNFVSIHQKEGGDTFIFVNSLGEGAMWVSNVNGALESGDFITTSDVPGYGMKQDDDILHNYTVAKITMDCDFNPPSQPVQRVKKILGEVKYWVQTKYINVTREEYDTLDENERTIEYSGSNPIYKKIIKEDSLEEDDKHTELDVRMEMVNDVDENGQMIWEETGETEKAYKIRYLDADGNITDEANAVHIAAFVGCTYHCG